MILSTDYTLTPSHQYTFLQSLLLKNLEQCHEKVKKMTLFMPKERKNNNFEKFEVLS